MIGRLPENRLGLHWAHTQMVTISPPPTHLSEEATETPEHPLKEIRGQNHFSQHNRVGQTLAVFFTVAAGGTGGPRQTSYTLASPPPHAPTLKIQQETSGLPLDVRR
ncbi:UNVERIFIED_CONTAM: hypothetical protein K2H54_010402 [Gekko kuhli]